LLALFLDPWNEDRKRLERFSVLLLGRLGHLYDVCMYCVCRVYTPTMAPPSQLYHTYVVALSSGTGGVPEPPGQTKGAAGHPTA